MASTAQTAQRSVVRINTAVLATKTITAITKSTTCVVTATHDYAVGDIIKLDAIVGMTELNGRAFVVSAISTTVSFTLGGVDSTNYTTYVSGGTAVKQTMTALGNIKDFNIDPDQAQEIDVTNLASTRKEYLVGLAGSWVMSCAMDTDTTDAGQVELNKAQNDGLSRVFTVTLGQSGKVFAGVGYVKSFSAAGSADSVVGGSLNVRGTGQPSWFV
jgi:hypothetical protein